jgi:hypothetical protein
MNDGPDGYVGSPGHSGWLEPELALATTPPCNNSFLISRAVSSSRSRDTDAVAVFQDASGRIWEILADSVEVQRSFSLL